MLLLGERVPAICAGMAASADRLSFVEVQSVGASVADSMLILAQVPRQTCLHSDDPR